MSQIGVVFCKVVNSTGHIVELFIVDQKASGAPTPDSWWVLNNNEVLTQKIELTGNTKMQLRMISESPSSPKGKMKVIHMYLSASTRDLDIYEGENIEDKCIIRTDDKVQDLDLIIEPRKLSFVNKKGDIPRERVNIINLINSHNEDQLGLKTAPIVMN